MYELPFDEPKETERRPWWRSDGVKPTSVSEAVGVPGAIACNVRPE
jgi:hypothetical protein